MLTSTEIGSSVGRTSTEQERPARRRQVRRVAAGTCKYRGVLELDGQLCSQVGLVRHDLSRLLLPEVFHRDCREVLGNSPCLERRRRVRDEKEECGEGGTRRGREV